MRICSIGAASRRGRTRSSRGSSSTRSGSAAERSRTASSAACCTPLHRGVYLLGSRRSSRPRVRARAALCAVRRGARREPRRRLRRCSASGRRPEGPIDVTVVGPARPPRAASAAHESTALARADVRTLPRHPRHRARARPARDRAELTPRELADAVEQAQVKRLVTKRDIERDDRARRPRRRRALRASEEPASRARGRARSCAHARAAPAPQFNARPRASRSTRSGAASASCSSSTPTASRDASDQQGSRVDALWRERVVLEFDSYAFHATRGVRARPPQDRGAQRGATSCCGRRGAS